MHTSGLHVCTAKIVVLRGGAFEGGIPGERDFPCDRRWFHTQPYYTVREAPAGNRNYYRHRIGIFAGSFKAACHHWRKR